MKEYGEKIPAEKKAPIESALTKLKEAHKIQDLGAIDSAMAELNTSWTAASEELYKASQGAQQGQPGGQDGHEHQGSDVHEGAQQTTADNVTDAEFEEVK